jgi:hypothetical protein
MARGFESKNVEAQQADREEGLSSAPSRSSDDLDRATRRRTIELARARAESALVGATQPAHRAMLTAGLADLDRQLTALRS